MTVTFIPAQTGWRVASYSRGDDAAHLSLIIGWKLIDGGDPEPVTVDHPTRAADASWAIVAPDDTVCRCFGGSDLSSLSAWFESVRDEGEGRKKAA